ncbi:MAG: AIM24 family protein [Cyanobacteria bacterium P01_A01_bin.135]
MQIELMYQATIDTGHLVAFHESMPFETRSIGGMKTFLFSGEGFVVDLTGPGKVLIQTRWSETGPRAIADQFLSWLIPKLPVSTSN